MVNGIEAPAPRGAGAFFWDGMGWVRWWRGSSVGDEGGRAPVGVGGVRREDQEGGRERAVRGGFVRAKR